MRRLLPGLLVWGLGLALALWLPGLPSRGVQPPAFPWEAIGPAVLAVSTLGLAAPLIVWRLGPDLATRRPLALLEAPPDLLWACLVLALWPAAWGPPGLGGWCLALLAAALPGEVRWLAQTLPGESPFPRAWGPAAVRRMRRLALTRRVPGWLGARLPVWLTATLVLERVLGVPGLGSDWLSRVVARDRGGLAAWVLVLAGLWLLTQRPDAEVPA